MSLINTLETRFGRYAIPGIVNVVAGFQVVVWVLIQFQPGFVEWLILDRASLLANFQLWRLITWVFVPGTNSPIWLLIAVLVMMRIGAGLEEAWGAFRLNLYLFSGIIFVIIGVLIFGGQPYPLAIYTSLFLAFAMLHPDFEFMLFFIIPVKVKWLAMITAGLLFLTFLDTPPARLPILLSLLNFFIAFGPGTVKNMKNKAVVTERRARFESAKAPEAPHFHKCEICGKTEHDDPRLDFRVTDEGTEYCTTCRPRTKPAGIKQA